MNVPAEPTTRVRIGSISSCLGRRVSPLRTRGSRGVRRALTVAMACLAGLCTAAPRLAAQDQTEQALEKYRQMLKADPWSNPAMLDVDRGETLWKTRGGPKGVSLESCDLGKGRGKIEGAFAELPRYFRDAKRVMDVEARVLWCMEKIQGFDRKSLLEQPFPSNGLPVGNVGAVATYIASKSSGRVLAPRVQHPAEKQALELGTNLFHRRMGPMDFSCATCHSETGKRIRLQMLPNLTVASEAAKVIGEWPAYRVSSAHVMTMSHRLYDCFWQMRLPRLEPGSEVAVALVMYLNQTARGGEIGAPGIKR